LSDDFDALFDATPVVPAPALGQAAGAITPANQQAVQAAAPAEEAPPSLLLALYKRGTSVHYEGARHTVDYVHISRKGLFLRLHEKDNIVPAEKVDAPLTRVSLPLSTYQNPKAPLPPGPARTK
jgi:hypothetical protein